MALFFVFVTRFDEVEISIVIDVFGGFFDLLFDEEVFHGGTGFKAIQIPGGKVQRIVVDAVVADGRPGYCFPKT